MTTTTQPQGGTGIRSDTQLSLAGLLAVLLGAGLSIVDFFIVNIALPTIGRSLGTTPATLELVVAGYGIAYGILLVLGGRLGDTFGRRRLYIAGLVLFVITSLTCGLATTVGMLVASRIAQGAAAALLVPQVLSTIQATTTGERRSRAVGWYGVTSGMSMIVGQLLGGVLVGADVAGLSWRPVFLVNVPIGLVAIVLTLRSMPETRTDQPSRVDRTGTVVFGLLILALLVPLMQGSTLGWPVWTWLVLATVPVLVAAFVVVERRVVRAGRAPLLPPSVLGVPSMRRGLLLAGPFFLGFSAFLFVYAVTLQNGLHLGPVAAGLAITPMAVAFLLASLVSSRLVTRIGQHVVTLGAALQATGIAILVITFILTWPHPNLAVLAPGMAVAGFGQGCTMTTLFRVTLSRVPAAQAGAGSGILATTQQVSLAAGVAVLGSLYLALAAPSALGMRNAFVMVMFVQILVAIVIVVAGRRLPDPRS